MLFNLFYNLSYNVFYVFCFVGLLDVLCFQLFPCDKQESNIHIITCQAHQTERYITVFMFQPCQNDSAERQKIR